MEERWRRRRGWRGWWCVRGRWERRHEWRWRWGHKCRAMRPRGKVAPARMVTMMSVVMSVVVSMTMIMPAWAPASSFNAMRVSHRGVFTILLGRYIVYSFPGCLFVIIQAETKETIWPLATTEGTNVLFVLFLRMSFHTNENTCKRSTRRLGEKEATKIIGRANRKYAGKL
jgi:hypothetical protein